MTTDQMVGRFFTKVVGVTHTNPDGSSRQAIIQKCRAGQELEFVREPDNSYDSNAIRVCTVSGKQLGYLSRDLAEQLAPRMDAGQQFLVSVTEVTGGGEQRTAVTLK